MRIGTLLPIAQGDGPGRTLHWKELLAYAQTAEAIGLDSIWVYDHLYSNSPGTEPEGILESWSVLAALAAATQRVELGQLVMCVSFRDPGLLAKMAVTTDEISGGRLILGLGSGWHDQEYRAFGFPTDHRVSRFEEALEVIVPLLRGETVTYAGRFHRVTDAVLLPAPSRRIPLLIAAKGERMLRLTALHADAWNTAWFKTPDERLAGRLADYSAALTAASRDPSTMRRTVGVLVENAEAPEAVEGLLKTLDAYAALGIDDVLLLPQPMTRAALDVLGEALSNWSGPRG